MNENIFLIVLRSRVVVNLNAWYIAMHLDRLNAELLSATYGKQEEEEKSQKKKQQAKNTNEKTKD